MLPLKLDWRYFLQNPFNFPFIENVLKIAVHQIVNTAILKRIEFIKTIKFFGKIHEN